MGQTGNQLVATTDCSLVGRGQFEGLIDDTSGDFSLLGNISTAQVSMIGTAALDGASISGTWITHTGADGTFTGSRRPVIVGDLDDDDIVDSVDAILVLQQAAQLAPPLPLPAIADANGDGRIDSVDALLILQLDAGLIDEFSAA